MVGSLLDRDAPLVGEVVEVGFQRQGIMEGPDILGEYLPALGAS